MFTHIRNLDATVILVQRMIKIDKYFGRNQFFHLKKLLKRIATKNLFLTKKNVGPKLILGPKIILCSKEIGSQKFYVPDKFLFKKSQALKTILCLKNAAKRSRQHAGKKYREYAQRRVCFVNKQVPCPTPI